MWQEIINDETIIARLKVSRKSPHNHQFTTIFFCRIVGAMKKMGVFRDKSDGELADKLTTKHHEGTYRKNIQEGLKKETKELQNSTNSILLKYNKLVHSKN
jgi:hypothetical protein